MDAIFSAKAIEKLYGEFTANIAKGTGGKNPKVCIAEFENSSKNRDLWVYAYNRNDPVCLWSHNKMRLRPGERSQIQALDGLLLGPDQCTSFQAGLYFSEPLEDGGKGRSLFDVRSNPVFSNMNLGLSGWFGLGKMYEHEFNIRSKRAYKVEDECKGVGRKGAGLINDLILIAYSYVLISLVFVFCPVFLVLKIIILIWSRKWNRVRQAYYYYHHHLSGLM